MNTSGSGLLWTLTGLTAATMGFMVMDIDDLGAALLQGFYQ